MVVETVYKIREQFHNIRLNEVLQNLIDYLCYYLLEYLREIA